MLEPSAWGRAPQSQLNIQSQVVRPEKQIARDVFSGLPCPAENAAYLDEWKPVFLVVIPNH
jgi:hypothetical protein